MVKQEPKARRIALAFPNALVASGNLMHGILDYAQRRGGWSFTRLPELLSPTADWLREWQGDGAFAVVTTPEDAAMLKALSFPVVNVMGFVSQRDLPTATLDHYAIGRLQAEHLLARRFRRLAYYGVSDLCFSQERLAGFREVAEAAGVHVAAWLVTSGVQAPLRLADQQTELSHWLRQTPPPFGVAASNDMRAGMVLDACQALGLRVPEEVAVIGVDNDPVIAPFSTPPLSSVARNDRELGFLGARLLDDLIEGRAPAVQRVLIPPAGVICRRSTETLAVESPELHALIQEIRAHIGEAFGVEFLTARSQASRRQLERLILKETGHTPHTLINQLRIEHACALLSQPDKCSLTAVANACGFADLRRFSLVFRQLTGLAPKDFRLQALKSSL